MPEQTLADVPFEQYRKPTRRERFLDERNRVVPGADLVAAIEPVNPKAEGPGRPPVGIERCCASIACNSGSTCRIQPWRRPCMTPAPCGSLSASIGAASPYPTRPRSVSFGIC